MRVPRFNMPFELGLAVALSKKRSRHQFAIFECVPYRLQQSLSDLNGYDPVIHYGTTVGMFEAVCDVFAEARPFPVGDAAGFRKVYRALDVFRRRHFPGRTIYTRDRFFRLVVAAGEYVRQRAIESTR